MSKKPDQAPEELQAVKSDECGATHEDCPNTWKGHCTRASGHGGSHFCSKCNSPF